MLVGNSKTVFQWEQVLVLQWAKLVLELWDMVSGSQLEWLMENRKVVMKGGQVYTRVEMMAVLKAFQMAVLKDIQMVVLLVVMLGK